MEMYLTEFFGISLKFIASNGWETVESILFSLMEFIYDMTIGNPCI